MPSNLSGQFACISELIGYIAFKNNINLAPRQNTLALVFFQMILQSVISVILLLFLRLCPGKSPMICLSNIGKIFPIIFTRYFNFN